MEKIIEHYPNYTISTIGVVKNKKNQIIKPFLNNKGYVMVRLWDSGVSTSKLVHRLVAQAFIPNPDNLPEVNHKDENKVNNDVNNLEWVTREENVRHSIKTGTAHQNIHGSLKNKRCKKVAQYDLTGRLLRIWNSTREPEHILGYAHGNIRIACRENKIRYGHKWKYIEESVETIPDEYKEVE